MPSRRRSYTKERVLVAGGAGCIGSNLCAHVLDRGGVVDCFDNLSTGSQSNIEKLRKSNRFQFIFGDISHRSAVDSLEKNQYTQIYNLACPTGVPNISLMGEEMMLASANGTLNLLQLARHSGSRFLYASSAEVYGNPRVTPQSEDYPGNVDPVGPRSAYEEGKRFGETLTRYFAESYGVDARIIRIFNTYGPNMSLRETRVIPSILRSLIEGKSPVIYGTGQNTRTFLFVDDLISGFELTMSQKRQGQVYNIGGKREVSIMDLLTICKRIANSNLRPKFLDHFIEDHDRRCPDTTRIEALGWSPQFDLEVGLAISYRDIFDRLNADQEESRSMLVRVASDIKGTKAVA